jgi:acetyl-CoA carboxylase, biotin carboxylase subunit
VYAEDPTNNFLPDIGKLHIYRRPQGNGVRVDDGFEEGMDIPIYYDPMIAKLIVHAENREAAIAKMLRAIVEYEIVGIQTTLPFCAFVLQHEAFTSGNFNTQFVQNYFKPEYLAQEWTEEEEMIAALAANAAFHQQNTKASAVSGNVAKVSNWRKNRV